MIVAAILVCTLPLWNRLSTSPVLSMSPVPSMGRNCTRDVEQLVEQLLQTRQGALEEQNNQMQQWQGDLENQCQLLQWEGALQINTVLLGNLWDNLKSVKDTAEKAYHQINNWMSTGTWP